MKSSVATRVSADDDIWFDGLPEKLARAVEAYDLSKTKDWEPLEEISEGVTLDRIETYGDIIVRQGKNMTAPGTVHVKIPYEDGTTFVERFPLTVLFDVKEQDGSKTVVVKKLLVDTSSFFS